MTELVTATVIEIVTEGPQGPPGPAGSELIVTSVDTSSSPQSVVISSALIAVDFNFFIIKDESNNASVNNITITTEGSEKIDVTLDSVVVNADSGGLLLYSRSGNLFSW